MIFFNTFNSYNNARNVLIDLFLIDFKKNKIYCSLIKLITNEFNFIVI